MQTIKITSVPNQRVVAIVNNQNVMIELRTIGKSLYFSLKNQDGDFIVSNSLCQPYSPLVRMNYFGFVGDFAIIPVGNIPLDDVVTWEKLDTVYQLVYDETGSFNRMGEML